MRVHIMSSRKKSVKLEKLYIAEFHETVAAFSEKKTDLNKKWNVRVSKKGSKLKKINTTLVSNRLSRYGAVCLVPSHAYK